MAEDLFTRPDTLPAADLTGDWSGTLSQGGESGPVSIRIGPAGYYVLSYPGQGGSTRTVELARPGQKIQFVPDGGGVCTYVVDAVDKQPGRLSYQLSYSFEGSNGGYLTQNYSTEWIDLHLTEQGLEARFAVRAERYFGDKGGLSGLGEEEVASGLLQRDGAG